ncbi:MAG: ATPase [Firmicutes bacterium]|jgi:hypothetical protein|nr:PRK06851 family protein [Bacillota bacterium]NLL87354.1 ATPase [Bacillota bacterium]HKM17107.1 PRK06851 family protein [Limnochordia bacterium]
MARIRKFFAGGCTPRGFCSLFDYIVGEQARRIYILKGGPGTGKSTLMAGIAAEALALGYDVEQFHCASDIDSLDGIAIPALKSAVVDGTAPHIIDPRYPGCVERVVNLGQFWDLQKISAHRDEIVELTDENRDCYQRVYRYLRAAKELHDDTYALNSTCADPNKINEVTEKLIGEIFGQSIPGRMGRQRKLFASAYTPQGQVNELRSIMEGFQFQYIIKGDPGSGRDIVLERIANYALAKGYDLEAYLCPLNPERIDHLALPQLSVALVSSYPPHIYEHNGANVVNLNDSLDQAKRSKEHYTLHKNFVFFDELINLALKQLRRAKAIHDNLEQKYIPAMDYSRLEQVKQEIFGDLLTVPC